MNVTDNVSTEPQGSQVPSVSTPDTLDETPKKFIPADLERKFLERMKVDPDTVITVAQYNEIVRRAAPWVRKTYQVEEIPLPDWEKEENNSIPAVLDDALQDIPKPLPAPPKAETPEEKIERERQEALLAITAKVQEINDQYAFINGVKNYGKIVYETLDAEKRFKDIGIITLGELETNYEEQTVLFEGKKVNPVKMWRICPWKRKIQHIVSDPSWTGTREGFVNHWNGWHWYRKATSCEKFLELIFTVIANGNPDHRNYILDWMADIIQHPTQKPGVVLALRGGPGAGKGTFATEFGKLFGPFFTTVDDPDQFLGKHNKHLGGKLLVFFDEGALTTQKKSVSKFKSITTSDTMRIEPKFVDSYEVDNHLHFIIATNEEYFIDLGIDDRRVCAFEVSDKYVGEEMIEEAETYFSAIRNEMATGGREALLNMLLARKYDKAKLRHFPRTALRTKLIERSFGDMENWWLTILERGNFPEYMMAPGDNWEHGAIEVVIELLYEEFREYKVLYGDAQKPPRIQQFGEKLAKIAPNQSKKSRKPEVAQAKKDKLIGVYAFPSLQECKNYTSKKLGGHPIP